MNYFATLMNVLLIMLINFTSNPKIALAILKESYREYNKQ